MYTKDWSIIHKPNLTQANNTYPQFHIYNIINVILIAIRLIHYFYLYITRLQYNTTNCWHFKITYTDTMQENYYYKIIFIIKSIPFFNISLIF